MGESRCIDASFLDLGTSCRLGLSNFKQVVIYFLMLELPVIYLPLSIVVLAISRNIVQNNRNKEKYE
jgi:hypothetical protein